MLAWLYQTKPITIAVINNVSNIWAFRKRLRQSYFLVLTWLYGTKYANMASEKPVQQSRQTCVKINSWRTYTITDDFCIDYDKYNKRIDQINLNWVSLWFHTKGSRVLGIFVWWYVV